MSETSSSPLGGMGQGLAPDSSTTVLGQAPSGPFNQTAEQKAIVDQAKRRFERALAWESMARDRFLQDLKFAEGDAYNGYQWPNNIRKSREVDQRPVLTINRARQFNLMIINDAKMNKPGVAVHPVGNEATYEAAQCLEGIVRHIEYISNASTAYDMATSFQVKAGYGVIRVATDYAGDDTFDQEIYIRPVEDPLSVMFDPDARLADKSDAKFAFVFDNVPKEDFPDIYPQYKDHTQSQPLGIGTDDWLTKDNIRICEYFYAVNNPKRIIRFEDPDSGQMLQFPYEKVPQFIIQKVIDKPRTRMRTIVWTEIRRAVIVGSTIAEENVWPGRYIPLIPVIGEETIITGNMDRKGHTRANIDPQRMYNYWSSAAVEFGALQTKSPWIAPAAAIEGYEDYWNKANTQNVSVLPWNHVDDDGQEIPPPSRPPLPEQAPLYISGMQFAQNEMMMVSGQFQAQLGQPSNERSGKAIQERQRQGDLSTYHFIDQLAVSIRHLGKILLDLIPHIYDAKRVVHIMAEDGKSSQVLIDPEAAKAYEEVLNADNQVAQRIFNPNIGKYEVQADVGPGYATKREQAFDAFTQIITQAPGLVSIVGDILLKAGDFPGADEAAQRLERMIPPMALGKGPTQQEQMLQQQLQQLQQSFQKTFDELVTARIQLKGKTEMRDIDAYDAETKRMAALKDFLATDPAGIQLMVRQLTMETMQTSLLPLLMALKPELMMQGQRLPSGGIPGMGNAQPPNQPDLSQPGQMGGGNPMGGLANG